MDLVQLKNSIESIRVADDETEEIKGTIEDSNEADLLKEKIQHIKNVFLDNWTEEQLPFIKEFYSKIQQGIPTPALSVCGRGTQEIRFTKYLAYFLDPSQNHGLEDRLLKAILQEKIQSAGLQMNWEEEYRIEEEVLIGTLVSKNRKVQCICDIAAIGDSFGIFIEQKILSAESNHQHSDLSQLQRYSKALDQHRIFKDLNKIKIYLTPDGRLPKGVEDWISLSHKDIIKNGMNLLREPSLSKVAKENLIRFLMDLATGPYIEGEEVLGEMLKLAEGMVQKGFMLNQFIRFRKLVDENRLLIRLIMEGV